MDKADILQNMTRSVQLSGAFYHRQSLAQRRFFATDVRPRMALSCQGLFFGSLYTQDVTKEEASVTLQGVRICLFGRLSCTTMLIY
jgi:3-deoxy-D-manno-octulosonic acid (KDO) 8-phosphate synthase